VPADYDAETHIKKPFGRPVCRSDDNIKTDLKHTGWKDEHSVHLAQVPVAGFCERGNEGSGFIQRKLC
jgi:hypothetical protein